MRLITTLVAKSKYARKILEEVPNGSVVLFPESVNIPTTIVKKFSKVKSLFIIYNRDIIEKGKKYISMQAISEGRIKWIVRKFHLWHSDLRSGFKAPVEPECITSILGWKCAIYICYDAIEIFKMREFLEEENVEILLISANWQFNFQLMNRIIDFLQKLNRTLNNSLIIIL